MALGVPFYAVAVNFGVNFDVVYEWRGEAPACRAWVAQQETLWRAMVPTPSQ